MKDANRVDNLSTKNANLDADVDREDNSDIADTDADIGADRVDNLGTNMVQCKQSRQP